MKTKGKDFTNLGGQMGKGAGREREKVKWCLLPFNQETISLLPFNQDTVCLQPFIQETISLLSLRNP